MLNDDACHSCGMITKEDREYHPYAACLLFKACGNGDTVRAELAAVKGHALNDLKNLKNLKQAAKEQGYALVKLKRLQTAEELSVVLQELQKQAIEIGALHD